MGLPNGKQICLCIKKLRSLPRLTVRVNILKTVIFVAVWVMFLFGCSLLVSRVIRHPLKSLFDQAGSVVVSWLVRVGATHKPVTPLLLYKHESRYSCVIYYYIGIKQANTRLLLQFDVHSANLLLVPPWMPFTLRCRSCGC